MNDKKNTIIYRFDEDGVAINPSSNTHEIEYIGRLKYKAKLEINWARTPFGWVGGALIKNVEGYTPLKKVIIECNYNSAAIENRKRLICSVLINLIQMAQRERYPNGILLEICSIYSKYSQYNISENE